MPVRLSGFAKLGGWSGHRHSAFQTLPRSSAERTSVLYMNAMEDFETCLRLEIEGDLGIAQELVNPSETSHGVPGRGMPCYACDDALFSCL